jgi:hypothetical protein
MQSRLKQHGVPPTYLADFLLLMQELGLARRRGGSRKTIWEVSCTTYFDSFVTDEWLEIALQRLQQRHSKSTANRKMRAELAALKGNVDNTIDMKRAEALMKRFSS